MTDDDVISHLEFHINQQEKRIELVKMVRIRQNEPMSKWKQFKNRLKGFFK